MITTRGKHRKAGYYVYAPTSSGIYALCTRPCVNLVSAIIAVAHSPSSGVAAQWPVDGRWTARSRAPLLRHIHSGRVSARSAAFVHPPTLRRDLYTYRAALLPFSLPWTVYANRRRKGEGRSDDLERMHTALISPI